MARKITEWPFKRGLNTKIMPSDGCKGGTVPLAVGQWYDFHEFGCHLGNVGLERVVARYRDKTLRRYFRGDAAFASPEVYEFLEAEDFKYTTRLPANKMLHDSIAHLLRRPVGRPPNHVRRYYASFSYQAGTWDKPRPVVAE